MGVHPHWLALIQWAQQNPFASCEVKFQNGLPMQILNPKESVLLADVARRLPAR